MLANWLYDTFKDHIVLFVCVCFVAFYVVVYGILPDLYEKWREREIKKALKNPPKASPLRDKNGFIKF